MDFTKTGCKDLDLLITGYPKNGISLIYGSGGSGKTTLCLMTADFNCKDKNVLYLDAGNNFSIERFEQISNKLNMNEVLILKIKNFNEQHEQIKKLLEINSNSLIIIDSFTTFYRRLHSRKPEIANAMLNKQLKLLSQIAKNNIPIILTSEVYSDMKNGILPIAKDILSKYCNTIIRLERNPRRLFVKKPVNCYFYFDIDNGGIKKKLGGI